MQKVCVVGFGAIGTIYSLALERSKNALVTAVCRSNYNTLKDSGLNIKSSKLGTEEHWRPYRVVRSTEEAADSSYDYVVCCFKALPDVITTPKLLGPLLYKSKNFVLLQNGIGIERDLQKAVPDATVISGCAWIDTTAMDGGRTVIHNSLEKLTLGVHPPPVRKLSDEEERTAKQSLDTFVKLLRDGGLNPDPSPSIEAERWRKVLWNGAFSTLCTLTRTSVPELFKSKVYAQTGPVIEELMREIVRVARAAGVSSEELPDKAVEETIALTVNEYGEDLTGQKIPPAYRPSMLVDLDHFRPMEVEAIIGGVIIKARELNVPVPQLNLVYASLKVIQSTILASRHPN